MELRSISAAERYRARSLLVASELPVADLDDPAIELFGAFDVERMVGVVGLQRCDDVGLLRSLAVDGSRRSAGVGRALCEHVLDLAHERGLADVYLLTTEAADYFARLGFAYVDRASAPVSIRATAQFVSLCSSTARVMRFAKPV